MELIAVLFITAILAHVWETVRDEHGHVRDTSRASLKQANPGRSKDWVKRHAAARTARWWGHELVRGFPAIRGNYEADRDHVRLLRTRGEADRFRTRAAMLEELRRAKKDRDDAAAEHERQRGIDTPPAEEDPAKPPADAPLPSETVGQPTRRPDGKPETGADKRFFDARETGYKGPVDQDGNPVPDLSDPDPARNQYPPGEPHLKPVPDDEAATPGAPQPPPEGDNMTTGTTTETKAAPSTGITGEAGGYEQAVGQAGQVQALAAVLQSQMETYQSELVTNAKLGGDTAVMSSMDQVMEAVQQMAAGMTAHLAALTAHEPGHEYATSVAAPADTGWLKSA